MVCDLQWKSWSSMIDFVAFEVHFEKLFFSTFLTSKNLLCNIHEFVIGMCSSTPSWGYWGGRTSWPSLSAKHWGGRSPRASVFDECPQNCCFGWKFPPQSQVSSTLARSDGEGVGNLGWPKSNIMHLLASSLTLRNVWLAVTSAIAMLYVYNRWIWWTWHNKLKPFELGNHIIEIQVKFRLSQCINLP